MENKWDAERFVRLEEKAAYLEKLALDLNEVVIAQGRSIGDLGKRIALLERQLHSGSEDPDVPHEKPPHY